MNYALGVDIGGTKVAIGIIREDGRVMKEIMISSNPVSAEAMYGVVEESMETIWNQNEYPIQGIGVGLPGKVNRKEGIAVYQNNLPWRDFPIAERIKEKFLLQNVLVDNDVSTAAYAEWFAHHPVSNETFVYITVSTGIASAAICDGIPLDGAGFSGELGLMYVKNYQEESSYERLENISSGTAIKKAMNNEFDAKQVFEQYHKGDKKAIHIIDSRIKSLADGVYSLACILDPDKMVFGGSIINNQPFIIEKIKCEIERLVIPEQYNLLDRLYVSKYQGNSGIIGAGLKVLQK
ncbi:ROK family protein [Gracilibacillus phocaeensis]|uniref:ROK family protein n=1 Tax=Gracilibacillus phocaeensis TaxID=2042304 RepID=UPI00102FC745|nr:ROK family protein [Gracilibacillus phocaeensis]